MVISTTKKRRENASVPRKTNPYVPRDQELKIEEGKRAKTILQLEKEAAAKTREEYRGASK